LSDFTRRIRNNGDSSAWAEWFLGLGGGLRLGFMTRSPVSGRPVIAASVTGVNNYIRFHTVSIERAHQGVTESVTTIGEFRVAI
jgi:hypothetical protein